MKTYILNGYSHLCFDDVEQSITSVTNSEFIENSAIAYTRDPMSFNGLFNHMMSAISGSQNLNGAPPFLMDTEENFNEVKAFVLNKFNSL